MDILVILNDWSHVSWLDLELSEYSVIESGGGLGVGYPCLPYHDIVTRHVDYGVAGSAKTRPFGQ